MHINNSVENSLQKVSEFFKKYEIKNEIFNEYKELSLDFIKKNNNDINEIIKLYNLYVVEWKVFNYIYNKINEGLYSEDNLSILNFLLYDLTEPFKTELIKGNEFINKNSILLQFINKNKENIITIKKDSTVQTIIRRLSPILMDIKIKKDYIAQLITEKFKNFSINEYTSFSENDPVIFYINMLNSKFLNINSNYLDIVNYTVFNERNTLFLTLSNYYYDNSNFYLKVNQKFIEYLKKTFNLNSSVKIIPSSPLLNDLNYVVDSFNQDLGLYQEFFSYYVYELLMEIQNNKLSSEQLLYDRLYKLNNGCTSFMELFREIFLSEIIFTHFQKYYTDKEKILISELYIKYSNYKDILMEINNKSHIFIFTELLKDFQNIFNYDNSTISKLLNNEISESEIQELKDKLKDND